MTVTTACFAAVAGFFGVATPYVPDRSLAIYAVLAVIVWKYFGFHMMLYIAGCRRWIEVSSKPPRSMSDRLAEVPLCDLPLSHPPSGCPSSLPIIGSLQLFDLVMPLTGAGRPTPPRRW